MDYAWVDNKVSSGTGWQVRKEKTNLTLPIEIFMFSSVSGKCILCRQCLFFDYHMSLTWSAKSLAGAFYCKYSNLHEHLLIAFQGTEKYSKASVDAAAALIFIVMYSHQYTGPASPALVLYLAVYICDCAHTLNTVILDTRPFDVAYIFYERECWKLCPSISLCQSQGQRRLPVSPLMFGRFDNSRRWAPGHWWSIAGLCRDRDQTLTRQSEKLSTRPPG